MFKKYKLNSMPSINIYYIVCLNFKSSISHHHIEKNMTTKKNQYTFYHHNSIIYSVYILISMNPLQIFLNIPMDINTDSIISMIRRQ